MLHAQFQGTDDDSIGDPSGLGIPSIEAHIKLG